MHSHSWLARPRNLTPGGIHDDATARRLGFPGGFVPGVALYEHIVNRLADQGIDWLRGGHVVFDRFRRPVYDGEQVRFSIDGDSGAFTVSGADLDDERARGRLSFGDAAPDLPHVGTPAPRGAALGDPELVGASLEMSVVTDPARLNALEQIEPRFVRRDGEGTAYPVALWLNPIDLVRAYFDAPLTVHIGGEVWHHAAPLLGEAIVKRGRITGFSERNGNEIVRFDVVVTTEAGRALATMQHASVYRLAREDRAT